MINMKKQIKLSGYFTKRSVLGLRKKKSNICSSSLEGFSSFVCLMKVVLGHLIKRQPCYRKTQDCSTKLCINKYWFAPDWTLVAGMQISSPNGPIDSGQKNCVSVCFDSPGFPYSSPHQKSISLQTEVLNECTRRCETLGNSTGELPVFPCQVLPTAASLTSP